MKRFKKITVGLLISLFVLPLQLIPSDFSYAKEPAITETTAINQEISPPIDGKIELIDKRTATSKTYLKSDGKKEMAIFEEAIHYQDSGNKWQDIDVNFEESRTQINSLGSKELKNRANKFELNLSEDLSKKAFSFQKDSNKINLTLQNIQSSSGKTLDFNINNLKSVTPERYKNRLTYKNVYKDTDIVYYSMRNGVKEDIVLNSYSGQNEYLFDLNLENTYFEKQKDGSYIFYKNGTKDILCRMPRFYMWDSKGGVDKGENQYSYDVSSEIIQNGTNYTLKISASDSWLSAPERVFPVVIDPSFFADLLEDTYVQTGYPDVLAWNQRYMWIGQQENKGVMRALVLFNIPVPELQGAKILSSRFEVWQQGNCTGICNTNAVIATTTTNFNPFETTWNNQPSMLNQVGSGFSTTLEGWLKIDITDAANHWIYNNYDGSLPGGLLFYQQGEQNWGYRTWVATNFPDAGWAMPKLIIEYNDYNATYEPTDMPNMIAGTTVEVPVKITNTGRNIWERGPFKLSYHWIDASTNETIIRDGLRTELTRNINKNGDSATLLAKVKVPPKSGRYILKWDMVHENVTWFFDQAVPTVDKSIAVTAPSFSSISHLGTESYYAKAGPVDLATGNLSYSSTDLAVNSPTGGLNITRSYNSNTLDQTITADSNGYIRSWLLNGPYKENNISIRLSRSYFPSEDTVRPSEGSTSQGNLWIKNDSGQNFTNLKTAFDQIGAYQKDYAKNLVSYANTYVYTPTPKNIKLKTGSDDGIKIWLNGKVIRSNDVYRGLTIDSDVDSVSLKQGWNSLLIKTTQGEGDWSMSARFTNQDGSPVSDLKYALNNPEVFQSSKITLQGWSYNFDELLYTTDPENIYYRDGTGTINIFTKNSDGSYKQPAGTDLKLLKKTDGTYYLETKTGIKKSFRLNGKIANVIDLVGNKLEYQYDTTGKCVKLVDGERFIEIIYGGSWISRVKDASGNRVLYMYTPTIGNITAKFERVINASENAFGYEYGENGKIVKYSDKKGNITNISYSNGKVSQLTDSLGNTTKFNYLDKSTEIIDALGRKTTANFNLVNLLTSFTNAKNYKELYIYDGSYNIVSVTPAIPENDDYYYKWSYAYDGENNLLSETNPVNATATYIYKGNDLIKATDPQGNFSEYKYSVDGRRILLSATDPMGNKNSYFYDTKRVIWTTDPKGAITKYSYTTDGDVATTTSPKGEITKFTYDNIGRIISETSPLGFTTKYEYDKLSRLTSVTDPGGLKITYTYDLNNNKTEEVYPNGAKKSFAYDKLDRLIKVTDEIGATIQYQYDAVGNKTKVTDANGKITTFLFDELNQPIKQTDPNGKTTTIEYDRNSNVSTVTDQRGNVSKNSYNKNGDLVTADSGGIKTTVTLNKNSEATKIATSNNQTTNISYDKNSNPVTVSSNVLGTSVNKYDQLGNLTQDTVTSATVDFTYDQNGNLASTANKLVKTSTNLGATNYSNDAEGKLKVTTKPNGDTATYGYDRSGRVTSLTNKNKSGAVQTSYSYTYDLASNQTKIINNTGLTQNFVYDLRNELTQEGSKKYTYDAMGNRKSIIDGTKTTKYEYDTTDPNRLVKATYPDGRVASYTYDGNGNIIKEIDSKSGTTTYAYDSDNYFTEAKLPNGTTITYAYDKVTKLRSSKTIKLSSGVTTTTKFDYSGDKLVSEMDINNNVRKSYTWDEQENLNSITIPINSVMTTYYFIKNAKGDVLGLSDKDGKMVVEYSYDAWGNITKAKNLATTGIPTDLYKQNPRLYGSYWYDYDIGLYFMKTRMYDSELGRFISKDQVSGGGSSVLSFNPYIYAGNNPISNIDPNGKAWWNKVAEFASSVVKAVIKAVEWVGEGINYALEVATSSKNKVVSWVAQKTLTVVDWTSGSALKTATVAAITGIAVGSSIVGGAIAVQASIAYLAGLGTYSATSLTAGAGGGGGAGYKTFNAVKSAVGSPGAGNQWHHVVEQCQVMRSGFSSFMVNNTSNIVAVPTKVHAQISGFYSSTNPYTGVGTVRDWLAGQSFQQQYDFGIQVMKNFGVIK